MIKNTKFFLLAISLALFPSESQADETNNRESRYVSFVAQIGCMYKKQNLSDERFEILFRLYHSQNGGEDTAYLVDPELVKAGALLGRSMIDNCSSFDRDSTAYKNAVDHIRQIGIFGNSYSPTQGLQAKCHLSVDNKVYIDGLCEYTNEGRDASSYPAPGSFMLNDGKLNVECSVYDPPGSKTCYGYQKRVTRNGTFAGVHVENKGYGSFWWNMGMLRKGQARINGVRQEGACWVNNRVRICAWAL
jgi:hypothetical protein